jgi:hypothetical protein
MTRAHLNILQETLRLFGQEERVPHHFYIIRDSLLWFLLVVGKFLVCETCREWGK